MRSKARRPRGRWVAALACVLFFCSAPAVAEEAPESAPSIGVDVPGLWIKGVKCEIKVRVDPAAPATDDRCALLIKGMAGRSSPCRPGDEVSFDDVVFPHSGAYEVTVTRGDARVVGARVRVIHGLLTLLPPLVAIGLALAFRQVLAALWISIWLGALIIYDWRPIAAIARSVDHYIIGAMADPDDAAMLIFIIFMGGMIGIIVKSGGIQGIVELIAKRATSPRRGQLATYVMGMFVFFDDYSNTIIVGNAMRPITDRLRISREKLAYLVDSTAAPLASIVPVSTWIGYEVGLIAKALDSIGADENAYLMFLESVLYRFYPIFALVLVFLVAVTGRDFGPMARAERRARTEGKPLADGAIPLASLDTSDMEPPDGKPRRWWNALVPIASLIVITFAGLWVNGMDGLGAEGYAKIVADSGAYGALWSRVYVLGQVYSGADPSIVLAWASLSGCIITTIMVVLQRILTLGEAMSAWLRGVQGMVIAIVILLMAWSLGAVCKDLHTAEYLTSSLAGVLSPRLLPVITFLIACGISFATGTSYGTMAILIPLAIPIANRLGLDAGFLAGSEELHLILIGVISSVLAGAVFGDHCSPISDTTIMSSMASSSDHVDHVRTQLPYALLAGAVGILVGDLPTAYGLHPVVSIVLGIAVMIGVLYVLGKRAQSPLEDAGHQDAGHEKERT